MRLVILALILLIFPLTAVAQDWSGAKPNTKLTLTRKGTGQTAPPPCEAASGWYGSADSVFCPGAPAATPADTWSFGLVDDAQMTKCNDSAVQTFHKEGLIDDMTRAANRLGEMPDADLDFDYDCTPWP